MSYMGTGIAKRYRKRPTGLAGFVDDVMDTIAGKPSQGQQCIDVANQTVAPFDAKIDDLVKTWNPTGFYTASEIRDLVGDTMRVVAQAQGAVDAARAEPNASQDSTMRATDDLARAGSRSLDYLSAANAADANGLRVVNAVGLKRWVTDTLATASSAIVTASVIGCLQPWWVSALAAFQVAFDMVWLLAKRTLGAVLAIGETALKIADDLPHLYDILKWVAIAGGAYWAWIQLHNLKRSGRTVL